MRANLPFLFVIIGAALWATDTLFRHPLSQQVSALTIVLIEHGFAMAITLLFLLFRYRTSLAKNLWMGWKKTIGAAVIGMLGSGLATLLFTISFRFLNPSVAILLQKIQPIVVIILSAIFLDEKLNATFFFWALIAMVSAYFVTFPNGTHFAQLSSADTLGAFLALSAAVFWAISTVVGRAVLFPSKNTPAEKPVDAEVLGFWRFLFGFLLLGIFATKDLQSRIELPFILADTHTLSLIFSMALISGYLGITLYYRGLAKVPASIATILELSFPLCAMWVNSAFLDMHLTNTQLVAAGVLLVSMVGVSRVYRPR